MSIWYATDYGKIKVGSADVRDCQMAGAQRRLQVADRGTSSRMDKRVAPDKEGAVDKQCLGERRKTLITNCEKGKRKPPQQFPETGYP